MSGFPKFLFPITVPAGGWDFSFTDPGAQTVTIPAATYGSILELVDTLVDAMNAASAVSFLGRVSSVGMALLKGDNVWNVVWGTTDDDLSDMLGYAETEAVVAGELWATLQHQHGYYPGVISYGYDAGRGAGLTRPVCWEPNYHEVRTVAGSMATRAVAAAVPQETMELACSLIKCDTRAGADEWGDADAGVRHWLDNCVTSTFRFYPDRFVGTVAAPGTVGTSYYNCAFAGQLRRHDGPHPSYCTWSVPINRESNP